MSTPHSAPATVPEFKPAKVGKDRKRPKGAGAGGAAAALGPAMAVRG